MQGDEKKPLNERERGEGRSKGRDDINENEVDREVARKE
jgi:hypothetical protein